MEAASRRDPGRTGDLPGEDLLFHLPRLRHNREQGARVGVSWILQDLSVGRSRRFAQYMTATRSAMFQAKPRS